jgi:hypothetical protein
MTVMHPKFTFIGNRELYDWCERVVQRMTEMFGITREEALAKINQFWQGQDFTDSYDLYLHETNEYWARVFYYDGHPPGDPRAP